METLLASWEKLLRGFKEKLAKRLWALPTVSEAEKENVYREYLVDLDQFESAISNLMQDSVSNRTHMQDENQLLRNLMGLESDQIRDQNVTLGMDLAAVKKELNEKDLELEETKRRLVEAQDENSVMRKRLKEEENSSENLRVHELKKREDDIRFFSEAQDKLQNQLKDLESRLGNLRHLYTENNDKLLTEKQGEISTLQRSLLEEMDMTLRKRQQLIWAEEDLFAKGIAYRVRTALVSAQGKLFLTLERLGLMDPETGTEAFWKSRLHLLVKGAGELSESFKSVTEQIQGITKTLDDYLHLTGKRELGQEPVDIKELIQRQMAEVYVDRRPTLHLEFLSDDPLPHVKGDKELLQFIIRALLQNSLEALPDMRGEVAVHVKNLGTKKGLRITVRDSGKGIPSNLKERVFQPFFTTKEGRQGFSLSRSKRYAELHGGGLTLVQSTPEGTTFELELPLQGGFV